MVQLISQENQFFVYFWSSILTLMFSSFLETERQVLWTCNKISMEKEFIATPVYNVEKPARLLAPLTLYGHITGFFNGIFTSLLIIYGKLWKIYGIMTI